MRGEPDRIAAIRLFPIQRERGAKAHRLLIPWSVAEKAYSVYSAEYGTSQSLERLAERGGFAPSEMDAFHPSWREESDEIVQLRDRLAAAERERDALREERDAAALARDQKVAAELALLTLQRHVREVLQQIRHIQVPPSLDEPFNQGYITGRADAAELVAALLPSLAEKEGINS